MDAGIHWALGSPKYLDVGVDLCPNSLGFLLPLFSELFHNGLGYHGHLIKTEPHGRCICELSQSFSTTELAEYLVALMLGTAMGYMQRNTTRANSPEDTTLHTAISSR